VEATVQGVILVKMDANPAITEDGPG